ncbi:cytochrome P450 724B1-like [Phoenix dactylifera]|uniref:Cytochrome P450 724B1-like n=1 Tax=Phoenix dactylifera TaxID=42345 RepID=A0A8B9A631_PHODC|nr:cytochrome P450 724B1-like [Phoenix dactylifera]
MAVLIFDHDGQDDISQIRTKFYVDLSPIQHNPIEGPSPEDGANVRKFLVGVALWYGKIFRSHLFGHPTIVSCDAEFNSFILQNEDRLFESSYPKNIPGVLGELTLLYVTGSEHKRLRGVALDLFAGMRTNASFISDIEDNVLQVMDSWKNKETLVFCDETRKFTFRVIVKQILSLRPEDPETSEILSNFKTFMRGLVSAPINIPGTPYAKAIQARRQIQEIVRNIWQRREREEQLGKGRRDFLDALIAADRVSEEEVLSLVLDLLLGGYETTSMLIAVIVKFLSVNPKMLSDLKEEHLMVRRSKLENEPMEWDDYKKMEFTQCLINEALRLGSVRLFFLSLGGVFNEGYHIPAGWKVLPIFSGAHLDPNLHPDPFRFDPSRWQEYDDWYRRPLYVLFPYESFAIRN